MFRTLRSFQPKYYFKSIAQQADELGEDNDYEAYDSLENPNINDGIPEDGYRNNKVNKGNDDFYGGPFYEIGIRSFVRHHFFDTICSKLQLFAT